MDVARGTAFTRVLPVFAASGSAHPRRIVHQINFRRPERPTSLAPGGMVLEAALAIASHIGQPGLHGPQLGDRLGQLACTNPF
jgi:hypothetical protein